MPKGATTEVSYGAYFVNFIVYPHFLQCFVSSPPPRPLCLEEEIVNCKEGNTDNNAVNNNTTTNNGDEDMPPKAQGKAHWGGQEEAPCQEDDRGQEQRGCRDASSCPHEEELLDRHHQCKGVKDYADVAIMVNGTIKNGSYDAQVAEDGLLLSWRQASRSKCFNKEILKKFLGDEYRNSSHHAVAWDDMRMEVRGKNVHSKQGLLGGTPMVVHLNWKCTGTPIVNVKDYPTSYKVKDKFGEVHTQCNCIILVTVKKAAERFKEAVKEERGSVDLFGDSSQSQMSGYSPPTPPP